MHRALNYALNRRPNRPTKSFSFETNRCGVRQRRVNAGFAHCRGFLQIKKRYADAGITVWNIGNTSVHNMPEVTLNLPGRDQKIEDYKQYLRNLGQAGIYYTTYAHMGNGIWNSGRATIRGASGRAVDLASPNKSGVWDGKTFKEPLSHGREFIEGGDLGELHLFHQTGRAGRGRGRHAHRHSSGRPAGPRTGRSAALYLRQFRRIQARMEIANSPNVGICLCCGTWLEGGRTLTHKDPEEMIRYFGARKIWKIHFERRSSCRCFDSSYCWPPAGR